MTVKLCSIDGCSRVHVARGLCEMHYRRWRRHGDTAPPPPRRNVCAVDGCERPVQARGWCQKHHRRWVKHGDPLLVELRGSWRTGGRLISGD